MPVSRGDIANGRGASHVSRTVNTVQHIGSSPPAEEAVDSVRLAVDPAPAPMTSMTREQITIAGLWCCCAFFFVTTVALAIAFPVAYVNRM